MFKVKATLVEFLGDEEKYPCHFQHKIGDEVVFDGERYLGRLCPSVWPLLVPKVDALFSAGPRYVPPDYYFPFWYAPVSRKDPSKSGSDGLGFANVLSTYREPQYHMECLKPLHAYEWPPHPARTVQRDVMLTCVDSRTAALFVVKAFDLADKGLSIPYFRRQMAILNKVLPRQGIAKEEILHAFSKEEQLEIYPALSEEIMVPLIEELEVLGYMEIKNGNAFVTKEGKAKVAAFKTDLSEEGKKALGM